MKKIELEIRGKVDSKSDLLKLVKQLSEVGKLIQERNRLSVILTDLNYKGIDVQVRLHNLEGELIVKNGRLTSAKRDEMSIKIRTEDFTNTLKILNLLGVGNGVVARAKDWIFYYMNAEVKVTLCDEKIFVWEIEALRKDQDENYLRGIAKKLGLKSMSEDDLREYWVWMKRNANKKFDMRKIDKILELHIASTKN